MARGFTLGASIDSSGALLPRLVIDGIDGFIEHVKPDANQSGRGWIHRMTLAGFRYDYLTRDAQISPHFEANDGYLFLIPESIRFHHECYNRKPIAIEFILAGTQVFLPPTQLWLTHTNATSATGAFQQPPLQEHTREEAVYAQASSYIAQSKQDRGSMAAQRPHSPTPVAAPISSVGYQQRATPLAIEPPPECHKMMLDYMSFPSIPGRNQQNSPRPQPTGQLPEGKRPSEAILSGEQDTSGLLNNAETLAATAVSEAQGCRLPPGRYLEPKNPLNPESLPKVEKPKSQRLTKLERSRLSQQQQSPFPEANHGPTVLEREHLDCTEIAETSSPSLDNMEQQQPQTFQRTSDALGVLTIPHKRTAQMVPRTHNLSLPQTPPQSLEISQQQKMQNDCDAYIQQCYGIPPSQDQDQDQEQLASPDCADQVNHYSDPKPTKQFPAQQNSVSDRSHETIDTQIAQTKRKNRTAPVSPPSENDESEVVKKSDQGITKQRRRTRASQEERIQMGAVDGAGDEDEEEGKDTRRRKKLRTYIGKRRLRGASST
ncbi:MAG: hypothetical protein Q9226_008264 [Calogaya cf. arnoldii]